MDIYIQALKFNFARYFVYPLEILTEIISKGLEVLFLVIFWGIALQDNSQMRYLTSYFLIASGVSTIVMSDETILGRTIRRLVKMGIISVHMVRPVNLIPYIFAGTVGKNGIKFFIAVVTILIGIIVNPSLNFISAILFFAFLISAFAIGFAFNVFEGALSFVFTEVNGIKNAMRHVTRVLSGAMVPLSYFPNDLRKVIELTPFPHMIYGPVNALKTTEVTPEILQSLLISFFWAIFLNIIMLYFWRRVMKGYEAVGI